MRPETYFLLCCCRAFLHNVDQEDEDLYGMLDISSDASREEIRKAYRKASLQYHPDKLAQRNEEVTKEKEAKFTKIKEAYEILSDPNRRATYDSLGNTGMKILEDPMSIDPMILWTNFSRSSTLDRTKIFLIFVGIAVIVLLLPVLICLQVDQKLGRKALWVEVLAPLWLFNGLRFMNHIYLVLFLGPIPRPEEISEDEWVDPLPMFKRLTSFFRFLLFSSFQVFAALKLDNLTVIQSWDWAIIFLPLILWEVLNMIGSYITSSRKIITIDEVEIIVGKPFHELTMREKKELSLKYVVVRSVDSPEYEFAETLQQMAADAVQRALFRAVFYMLLVLRLDDAINWNWWLIFAPFWMTSLWLCCFSYQKYREATIAAEVLDSSNSGGSAGVTDNNDVIHSNNGDNDLLSEEEKAKLMEKIRASGSKMANTCCNQCFLLLLLFLVIAKVQGAGYSTLWIISPLLATVGLILCCLGCGIYGVTEQDMREDGEYYDMESNQNVTFHFGMRPRPSSSGGVSSPESAANMASSYNPPSVIPTYDTSSVLNNTDNDIGKNNILSSPDVLVPPDPVPSDEMQSLSHGGTAVASTVISTSTEAAKDIFVKVMSSTNVKPTATFQRENAESSQSNAGELFDELD